MFSNHRSTNRILGLFTFVAALILYWLTMAPTASFWDPGEFIAVGYGLQVNHPPGAPFYELLGRLFSMFMPTDYVAASINFISVLSSAFTVSLLYMIVVRLVREWKGDPDKMSDISKIAMYGGALIGAFTFAVTDSFWFNAVEAEVYALSMFFTALVVWLVLVWSDNHKKPYNERWLILIAYLFGIALGVHLLNLLAIFFVGLIIYFRKREFEIISFIVAAVLAVISFLIIYPFTLQMLPSILQGLSEASYGLIGPVTFMIFIVLLIGGGIYYTHKNNYRMANIVFIGYAMILIGYSSYALVFIRSGANPPIDENNPETVESFISYLGREQYGKTPLLLGHTYNNETGNINREEKTLFPRRYSSNPRHLQEYQNYSSDWDYFWNYQINHMYVRYFNWNFIGREADIQDTGWQAGFAESEYENNPAHNGYFFIPFLLGLLGMFFHFQRDWKRAFSVLIFFLLTGVGIIIFLNQTPLEPRERDYAYVGSFFAFSIWIGIGGMGLIELARDYLKSSKLAAYGIAILLFCASPLLMGTQNYYTHDRSERYVAPDYAYNLLQSTAPNAILFTNGDNDTFPLWYMQEVEGVRTDVRVVNLSLLNTDWYIKQMRDQWSHDSPPLPISLTNDDIKQITSGLTLHEPDTVSIPVNKEMLKKAFSGEQQYEESIGIKAGKETPDVYSKGVNFGIPVDSLDNTVHWYYKGRPAGRGQQGNQRFYTQVQDKVILNILKNNQWLRPIYFANTVSSQSQLGLQPYFRFEGKAFRIVPNRHSDVTSGWVNPSIHAKRLKAFRFRGWKNPDIYLNENIRRMVGNYRFSVTELANKYKAMGKPDSARYWLNWGEEHIPFDIENNNVNPAVLYAYSYSNVGDDSSAVDLAKKAQKKLLEDLKYDMDKFRTLSQSASELNQKIDNARQSTDMDEANRLQQQVQQVKQRRQELTRGISFGVSHLTILQNIYYNAGLDDRASRLANRVDEITGAQVSLPDSKEESQKQVNQLGIN